MSWENGAISPSSDDVGGAVLFSHDWSPYFSGDDRPWMESNSEDASPIGEDSVLMTMTGGGPSAPDFLTVASFVNFSKAAVAARDPSVVVLNGGNDSFPFFNPNATSPAFPEYIRTVSTVVCVIILTVGLLGNSLVPVVIWRNRDLRNSTNLFLVNLALADLLVLLLTLPTALVELQGPPEAWVLGRFLCHLLPFVEQVVPHASVLTIVAISFERYVAICEPLQANYKLTKIRAVGIIVLVWVLAVIFTSPIFMMTQYKMEPFTDGTLKPVCMTSVDGTWDKVFHFFCMFVFFVLPLLILIVIYIAIARHLLRHPYASACAPSRQLQQQSQQYQLQQQQTGAAANNSNVSNGNTRGGKTRLNDDRNVSSSHMKSRRQVVAMLATVIVVFFICLLPFRIFTFWYIAIATTQDIYDGMGVETYYGVLWFCRVMLYLNSAVNPILYNVMSSKFRDAFLRVLGVMSRHHYHHGRNYHGSGVRGRNFVDRGGTMRSSSSARRGFGSTITTNFNSSSTRSLIRRSSSSAYSSVMTSAGGSRRMTGLCQQLSYNNNDCTKPAPLVHQHTQQLILHQSQQQLPQVKEEKQPKPLKGISALIKESGNLACATLSVTSNDGKAPRFRRSASFRLSINPPNFRRWRHSDSGHTSPSSYEMGVRDVRMIRRSRTPDPPSVSSLGFNLANDGPSRSFSVVSPSFASAPSSSTLWPGPQYSPQQGFFQLQTSPLKDGMGPCVERELVFQVPTADGKGFQTLPGRISRVPSRSPSRSPSSRLPSVLEVSSRDIDGSFNDDVEGLTDGERKLLGHQYRPSVRRKRSSVTAPIAAFDDDEEGPVVTDPLGVVAFGAEGNTKPFRRGCRAREGDIDDIRVDKMPETKRNQLLVVVARPSSSSSSSSTSRASTPMSLSPSPSSANSNRSHCSSPSSSASTSPCLRTTSRGKRNLLAVAKANIPLCIVTSSSKANNGSTPLAELAHV